MTDESIQKVYIDINDAAELTGYSAKYLRKLIREGSLVHQKTKSSIMILWTEVQRLASQQKPLWVFLPDNALDNPVPEPNLLLYTETENVDDPRPVEYFHDEIFHANCIDLMRQMPSNIIQSVVTSPPYWGVRKYPESAQFTWADGSHEGFGEEAVVERYVSHTLEVLRHLKRVLRDDGTIWWNMGDTYQTRAYLRESSTERINAIEGDRNDLWKNYPHKRYSSGHSYLKDKDLTLVPFLVANGAQRLGLYLRSVIIWWKSNTVPEPVDDRPTTSHEYIFLFAKSRFYKYNNERDTEVSITKEVIKRINGRSEYELGEERNLRTVWQFPPSSRHGDHTAAFPLELPMRCLKLSTSPGDLVFDPFAGSGTTLAAAKILGCHYCGCDVVDTSVNDSKRRAQFPTTPLEGTKRGRGATNSKKAAQGSDTVVGATENLQMQFPEEENEAIDYASLNDSSQAKHLLATSETGTNNSTY